MEQLTPIPDWPGYSITPCGKVWSHKSNKWLTAFPHTGHAYYYMVKLYRPTGGPRGTGRQNRHIHTLVGRTYLPYIPGAYICHRDETLPFPDINHVSNLFIGSFKDNSEDAITKGRLLTGQEWLDKWGHTLTKSEPAH